MSEPVTQQHAVNSVFYQILKPGAIKDQHGNDQFAIIGMAPDLAQASTISARVPGSLIVFCCVIFQNPMKTLPPVAPPANR